jgi:hypothetical protein
MADGSSFQTSAARSRRYSRPIPFLRRSSQDNEVSPFVPMFEMLSATDASVLGMWNAGLTPERIETETGLAVSEINRRLASLSRRPDIKVRRESEAPNRLPADRAWGGVRV